MYLLLGYGKSNKSIEKYLIKQKIKYLIYDDIKFNNNIDLKKVSLIIKSNGISNDHINSIGYNENIDKDMWKENKCLFEIYISKDSIVCWMNGKMMIHQKYEQFEKIFKKKMFIGITASSSYDGYLAISDFGIKSQ